MAAGIYKITQKDTGRVYIGKAESGIGTRWDSHITRLVCGRHGNAGLQIDVNRYGIGSLTFEIIEFLPYSKSNEILSREQFWVDTYRDMGIVVYNVKEKVESYTFESVDTCLNCKNMVYKASLCQEHYHMYKNNPRVYESKEYLKWLKSVTVSN